MVKNTDRDGEVFTRKIDTSQSIRVVYDDENHFNKLTKSLKVYMMTAYKDLIFLYVPKLREGEFVGVTDDGVRYVQELHSSDIFDYVHGKVMLIYRVDGNRRILEKIEPEEFLIEGHSKELPTYRGVPITGPKDRFKIDLFYTLKR